MSFQKEQSSHCLDSFGDSKCKIVVGGNPEKTGNKTAPNLNLSFDFESGEEKCFLNLNRRSKQAAEVLEKDGKIQLGGDDTDIFHVDQNGRLKWDIEFSKKPDKNVFEWDLLAHPDVSFHYQGELTQKEIDKGAVRSAEVVGSYAVYFNKSGHYRAPDGKTLVNYATGKLCHIYRPLCTSADGVETWADLQIADGKLRITIPQDYLDQAVYPVVLDPTFGVTAVGGSSTDTLSANRLQGSDATSPSDAGNATVDSLACYLRASSAGYNAKGLVVLGSNLNFLSNGISPAVSLSTTAQWVTLAYSTKPVLSASTSYRLCYIADGTTYPNYDSVSNAGIYDASNSYSSPTNPTDADDTDSWKISIYCNYTVAIPLPVFINHYRQQGIL